MNLKGRELQFSAIDTAMEDIFKIAGCLQFFITQLCGYRPYSIAKIVSDTHLPQPIRQFLDGCRTAEPRRGKE